jgi:hypothetical protein
MGVVQAIMVAAVETATCWTLSTCFSHRRSFTRCILISHTSTGLRVEARLVILKASTTVGCFGTAFHVTASALKICKSTIAFCRCHKNLPVRTPKKPELRLSGLTLGLGFSQPSMIRVILSSLELGSRNRRTPT